MVRSKECIEYYNFKDDISLYSVQSLKKTLKKHNEKVGAGNKADLYKKVKICIESKNVEMNVNIKSILKIQSQFRMLMTKYYLKLCGPGFYNRDKLTNDTDFLTCDTYKEVPYYYFFSYRDNDSFIYYFDIRSFKKLVSKPNARNPYNRKFIPRRVILTMNKRIKYLKSKKISLNIEDDPIPDKNSPEGVKRTINDIFIELSANGYNVQEEWFNSLTLHKYKLLYRNLEDIWNFRSELTLESKRKIVPPNGILFTTKPNSIISINDSFILKKFIVNDTYKLIMSGENIEDRKTGMMYFIIALSEVNPNCLLANPWVSFLNSP
jgi:hypothetical protein